MTKLPIAPPPRPDEALSSWIARIAARYDLAADNLVQYLLPNEIDVSGMSQWIDVCRWPPLEDALAEATNRPLAQFAQQRLAGLAANPDAAWPRDSPAWCPLCVAQDVAECGEVYSRTAWTFGGYLLCPQHRCLLIASCPICLRRVAHRPVNGRLRLWCEQCDRCADNALAPREIPFWPFGTRQQHRRCVTIRLTAEARPLLLRVQSGLMAALRGERSREPWARGLKPARLIAALRQLSFVMLGPLWEDAYRFQQKYRGMDPPWSLPDDWTPGSLPPEIAAPALLASVTLLAAERRTRLEGITWNPRLLLPGEGEHIEAVTLIWHLDSTDAEWMRRLFDVPVVRPLALLLAALHGDQRRRGAMREAARRRQGVGGTERRIRDSERRRATETETARTERERREQRRFAVGRFIDGYATPAEPRLSRIEIDATFAVYATIGSDGSGNRVPADCDDTLLGNRYIRLWLARHKHHGARWLISTLVEALEAARLQKRGPVLPELPATTPARMQPAP